MGSLNFLHLLKFLEHPRSLLAFRFQQDVRQCYFFRLMLVRSPNPRVGQGFYWYKQGRTILALEQRTLVSSPIIFSVFLVGRVRRTTVCPQPSAPSQERPPLPSLLQINELLPRACVPGWAELASERASIPRRSNCQGRYSSERSLPAALAAMSGINPLSCVINEL